MATVEYIPVADGDQRGSAGGGEDAARDVIETER
jgi:hypothetical protein